MLKRILALIMCLVLAAAALPVNVSAASEEEVERIEDQLHSVYWKAFSSSGKETLKGYCGILAGWSMYFLGITESPITQNGNEMYNILSDSDQICEGYSAECYPASRYTIEEALNTITNCGTKDAYNIMVGFQWTNTEAGNLYGHVVMIHAVLDGVVYYNDCFYTPYNVDDSRAKCTIAEFNEYYNSWTSFEGMIHFGDGNRVAGCDTYSCDLFVSSETPVTLLSKPDFLEAEKGRTIAAGERVHATALCQNYEGVLFYRVEENGAEYYVPADQMTPEWFEYGGLEATDIVLPEQVDEGDDFALSGVIRSQNTKIYNAVVEVTDATGQVVMTWELLKDTYMLDLSTRSVNTRVDISNLAEGSYTYSVYCDMVNYYCLDGDVIDDMRRVLVDSSYFTVGDAEPVAQEVAETTVSRTVKNGWQHENGSWYYYENGVCRIGWFCYNGVDYYLQEDGSAVTGWQTINGKNRYFSETGAMRIGWLSTEEGSYYMRSNGVPATGLITVEGSQYFFSEDGLLVTDSTVEYKGQSYNVDGSGIATLIQ